MLHSLLSFQIISTSNNVYSGQQQQSQQQQQQSQINAAGVTYSTSSSTPFSVYSTTTSHSVPTATPPLHNSVYHSSSYQPHPAVTASFQSYLSYPSSIMQPYQVSNLISLVRVSQSRFDIRC